MSTKRKKSVLLEQKAKNVENWKKATFTLTALTKYIKGDGRKGFDKLLALQNEKHKTALTFKDFANTGALRELFAAADKNRKVKILVDKDGEPRQYFSLFHLETLAIGQAIRNAKAQKAAEKLAASEQQQKIDIATATAQSRPKSKKKAA